MISELDRRILAAACGLCWHEATINPKFNDNPWVAIYQCSQPNYFNYEHTNRTFTTPGDWELVRTTVVVPNIKKFISFMVDRADENMSAKCDTYTEYWLTLSPEARCQLVADWLKERA